MAIGKEVGQQVRSSLTRLTRQKTLRWQRSWIRRRRGDVNTICRHIRHTCASLSHHYELLHVIEYIKLYVLWEYGDRHFVFVTYAYMMLRKSALVRVDTPVVRGRALGPYSPWVL